MGGYGRENSVDSARHGHAELRHTATSTYRGRRRSERRIERRGLHLIILVHRVHAQRQRARVVAREAQKERLAAAQLLRAPIGPAFAFEQLRGGRGRRAVSWGGRPQEPRFERGK